MIWEAKHKHTAHRLLRHAPGESGESSDIGEIGVHWFPVPQSAAMELLVSRERICFKRSEQRDLHFVQVQLIIFR